MPDYYKYYSKNYNDPVSKLIYNKIITDFNKELCNLVIHDQIEYTFPHLGFELMIRKIKKKVRIVDGKLANNLPIDWQATKKLWEEDEEAKNKKLLIRQNNSHTSGYIFKIYLRKYKAKLKNKSYYQFMPNRIFKRNLAKRIKDKNKNPYDAYLLYQPYNKNK